MKIHYAIKQILYFLICLFLLTGSAYAYSPDSHELDQGVKGRNRSIKAYVDKIGTTDKGTIRLVNKDGRTSTTYTFKSSETIPSNITLIVEHGAFLQFDNGVTLTQNGPFKHGLSKCFTWTGTGKIRFGDGAVKEVYPEWWGAYSDETHATETTAAIKKAILCGASIMFSDPTGIYLINDTIQPEHLWGQRFEGKGATIKLADNTNKDMIDIIAGRLPETLFSLVLDGNGANQTSGSLIRINRGLILKLKNLRLKNAKDHSIIITATDAETTTTYIDECYITQKGIYIDAIANIITGLHINKNTFENMAGEKAIEVAGGNTVNCSVTKNWFEGMAYGVYANIANTKYMKYWNISDNKGASITSDFVYSTILGLSHVTNNHVGATGYEVNLGPDTEGNFIDAYKVNDQGRNIVYQRHLGSGTWSRLGALSLSYQTAYNYIKNADLERWSAGTLSEWTYTGTPTVTEESTTIYTGKKSCHLLADGGANGRITQTLPPTELHGKVIVLGAWVKANAASKACVQIWDNIGGTTSGSKNSTTSWELVTVSKSIDETATSFKVYVQVDEDANAYIDSIVCVQGYVCPSFIKGNDELTPRSVQTFVADDATPSVHAGDVFKTANANPTTITMFDNGVSGQQIKVIIGDANTTIDFTGTNLKGNTGVDWTPGDGDWMECVFDGTDWYCSCHDCTA